MRIPARFAEHVAAGDLASYSFIEPNYHNLGVNNSQPSALRDGAGCYLVFRLPASSSQSTDASKLNARSATMVTLSSSQATTE